MVWYMSQVGRSQENPYYSRLEIAFKQWRTGGQNAHNSLGMIKADLTELISLFKLFKSENKAINQGPSSSLSGLSTVPLLLLFYGFLR